MSEPTAPAGAHQNATVIHASALLVGPVAILIRGPSGAGKSSLVLDLIETLVAENRFVGLIGDDRVALTPVNGRLIVRTMPQIAGLIERRGIGITRLPFEPAGVVGLVVDLVPGEPNRLPEVVDQSASLCGINVRRIEIAGYGAPRTRLVLAAIDNEKVVAGSS